MYLDFIFVFKLVSPVVQSTSPVHQSSPVIVDGPVWQRKSADHVQTASLFWVELTDENCPKELFN